MAIKILAYQHGIYPRSEEVVSATRGLDRGRVNSSDVEAAYQQDLRRWIEVQRQAHLDFFSDGLLRWQDIFRPLVEGIGQKPHTLVRWFDTNTFFREPEFSSSPVTATAAALTQPAASLPGPAVVTLPSPFLFSRASRTNLDRNRLMVELAAALLRPAVRAAVSAGAQLIHLEEPWLAYYGIDPADWAPLREALEALRGDSTATFVLHLYFGDAAPHLQRLAALPVDAVGVDLMETDVSAFSPDWEKGIVLGLVNGRRSTVESSESLVQAAQHLADTARPNSLFLSSNCELGYLPTTIAERKVQRLGEAAQKVRQLVSV